ncbi:MAG: hypothetical protein NTY19_19445 [Planctomycetota bacterium]|nr:hypothetical protein [Planctomycetota bacterium]
MGYRFARYADDFVVVCQTYRQAYEALALVERVLKDDLGLHGTSSSTTALKRSKLRSMDRARCIAKSGITRRRRSEICELRPAATVKVGVQDAGKIRLTLTCSADAKFYDQPLTLVFEVAHFGSVDCPYDPASVESG